MFDICMSADLQTSLLGNSRWVLDSYRHLEGVWKSLLRSPRIPIWRSSTVNYNRVSILYGALISLTCCFLWFSSVPPSPCPYTVHNQEMIPSRNATDAHEQDIVVNYDLLLSTLRIFALCTCSLHSASNWHVQSVCTNKAFYCSYQ